MEDPSVRLLLVTSAHLHCQRVLSSLYDITLPVLTPALVLIQLHVAVAPCPSRFGKVAARSPGRWDILPFRQVSPVFVLAGVRAAVGYHMIQQSNTESWKQRGDCGWSGVKDSSFSSVWLVSVLSCCLPLAHIATHLPRW